MRLLKFSVVGTLGIVVQVAVLAALMHLKIQYLVSTACAVEMAVLHNFCWHQRFTWRDRGASHVWARLTRFHVSNAVISLAGNLFLMRILVGVFRMQPIAANLLAIGSCATLNYFASDCWVFTVLGRGVEESGTVTLPYGADPSSA